MNVVREQGDGAEQALSLDVGLFRPTRLMSTEPGEAVRVVIKTLVSANKTRLNFERFKSTIGKSGEIRPLTELLCILV